MNIQSKTLTYINPSSKRPILRNIYDAGSKSAADENITFVEVVETLHNFNNIANDPIFIQSLEGEREQFMIHLTEANHLANSANNLYDVISVIRKMFAIGKELPPTVCASFITTQLRPFLKEERYNL